VAFKFSGYISQGSVATHLRANLNKSPLNFWRKGNVSVSRDCQNFLGIPYYLRNG